MMTGATPTRFDLDPRLAAGSVAVADWPLSQLRLKDDARWPWLLLVPRRPGLVELTDLADADYEQLARETRLAVRLVQDLERPDKVNVGAIGNVVRQLHVHVVGRRRTDAAWPAPIWTFGVGPSEPAAAVAARTRRYAEAAAALIAP